MRNSEVACRTVQLAFYYTRSHSLHHWSMLGCQSVRVNRERGDLKILRYQDFKILSAWDKGPWFEGWGGFYQASKETVKLVTRIGKEISISYILPTPACHWFLMPAFPLTGICQGFLRTCISVSHFENHAMTSFVSVILHHSLSFFLCPNTPKETFSWM